MTARFVCRSLRNGSQGQSASVPNDRVAPGYCRRCRPARPAPGARQAVSVRFNQAMLAALALVLVFWLCLSAHALDSAESKSAKMATVRARSGRLGALYSVFHRKIGFYCALVLAHRRCSARAVPYVRHRQRQAQRRGGRPAEPQQNRRLRVHQVRVRSHCRLRNRGNGSLDRSGVK
jgi:hypothetical protein